ncbi:hypothetical protein NUW58_g10284 [Xylaria curta]|uniref:Uncharacterized protein n=1 Tax=Xylaria curta TaxID=42375 RepID=A0ACC1MN89_9PEZI|nr:hypothetical protein NUW58_g10284 [Xylaria curta]
MSVLASEGLGGACPNEATNLSVDKRAARPGLIYLNQPSLARRGSGSRVLRCRVPRQHNREPGFEVQGVNRRLRQGSEHPDLNLRDAGEGWLDVCGGDDDDDLDELVLWVEIKKQIEILREGMGSEKIATAPGRTGFKAPRR